jgi:hypothetical protein
MPCPTGRLTRPEDGAFEASIPRLACLWSPSSFQPNLLLRISNPIGMLTGWACISLYSVAASAGIPFEEGQRLL